MRRHYLAVILACFLTTGAHAANPDTMVKPMDAAEERALLAPDRERINAIDAQILSLLGERFAVVRDVAALKAKHGIHPVLPDRIDEVVGRARDSAVKQGFDPNVAEKIYRILIAGAIDLETEFAKSGEAGSR